jgi:transcriptional regulator with XRE-family HTH domain
MAAAKALGLPRSAISLIENGLRKIDAIELFRFAEIYDRPLEAFFGPIRALPTNDSERELMRVATDLGAEDRAELLRFARQLRSRGGLA